MVRMALWSARVARVRVMLWWFGETPRGHGADGGPRAARRRAAQAADGAGLRRPVADVRPGRRGRQPYRARARRAWRGPRGPGRAADRQRAVVDPGRLRLREG